jgi:hypothetical protein
VTAAAAVAADVAVAAASTSPGGQDFWLQLDLLGGARLPYRVFEGIFGLAKLADAELEEHGDDRH